MNKPRFWLSGNLIALTILSLSVMPAIAQTKPQTPTAPEKVINAVTFKEVQTVLGVARDDNSGISDFSQGDNGGVIIAYHYYDVDQANYENDFSMDITPKIQQMYKKFKNFDRVRFEVITNNPSAPPLWIPFASFEVDRKTVEQLHFTWFVARYVLDEVLKNKK
jgi:hypothetical protein